MKKLFLLIPALVLSLLASATTINITPTSPYGESDNLRKAVYYATDGDEIVLADGTYFEPKSGGYLVLDKNLTIKAAEGAHPIVQFEAYAQLSNAAKVKFQGIKFDGSLQGSYDYFFRAYDVSASCLLFDDCEFYSIKNEVFRAKSDVHMDSLIVNNCYFHNNQKNVVYIEASGTSGRQTCDKLVFTNSTVAISDSLKNYTSTIDIRPYGSDNTNAIKVIVDHCTFYDNPTINTDHSAIRPYHLTDVTISNCIFVKGPNQKTARNATSCYGGNIKNCLVHELNYSSSGHRSGPTVTNNIVADPLFNDLANNKYTYAGTYGVSMSPARGAGTDGSDLGDPRWYTPVTYPSTNFASPGYYCSADAATISANVYGLSLYSDSEPHYIKCNEATYNALLAKWSITATRACYISVALDLGPEVGSNKHIFEVKILDANSNPVGTLAEDPADPDGDTANNTEADQVKTLDGSIVIPEAGNYTIELRSIRGHGKGSIKNIILTYDGDAPITDFASPGFEFLAKRATLDGNIEYNTTTSTPYIRYTDNSDPGTATWSVKATRACQVKVAMNMVDNSAYSSGNGKHIFVVELLDGNEVKSSVEETGEVDENGRSFPRSYDMPGCITIPEAGDYTLRLRNTRAHSRCGLASMTLTYTYEGGATVDIPNNEIPFEDAILGNGATRDLDSDPQEIHFGSVSAYAQWNIHATAGVYTFTFDVVGTNYGTYKLDINQGNTNVFTYTQGKDGNGTVNISNVLIPAEGDYVLQLANTNSGANGYLTSLAATAASDVIIVDENETDPTVLVDGTSGKKPQLIRSFKADMYNTICLPFDSYNEELEGIFGTDYVLMELNSAELSGDVLDLEFTTIAHEGSNYSAGKPYLIKPTKDVVNPKFSQHTIHFYEYNNPKSCTNADFIGSFIKTTIDASEYNLFLGANDKLYFSNNDVTLKGMRAYFQIKDNGTGAPVRKARIVEKDNVVTELELINGEWQDIKSANGIIKTIENGQLILIRDGKRYNVMGIRF